jgi:phenylacetic acid degradation operon negative regulatory protein
MNQKTEEFLNLLLWVTHMLIRPTLNNLTESYEGWAYRNGLIPRVSRLQQQKLLERDAGSPDERLYRLTEKGRLHVLGGRDPDEHWSRPWDGRWRIVLYDVPTKHNTRRTRLRRRLRAQGFGYLQNSVWITPDPMEEEKQILGRGKINVETLILLEANPCGGESDAQIVTGAWDFERINRGYTRPLKVIEEQPKGALRNERALKAMVRWRTAERAAWLEAVTNDPLLPARILPSDYLGQRAWQRRKQALKKAGQQLRTFKTN